MILATIGLCSAQVSSTISLSNGIELRIKAVMGGAAGQQSLTADLAGASGNSIYRIFRDQNQLTVFAYELAVEQTRDGKQVRIDVKPAGAEFAAKFPSADAGKPTPTLASERQYGPLASGGRVSIELFDVPPNGGVADTVEFKLNRGSAAPVIGPAEGGLRFAGLRVKVNVQAVALKETATTVTGRYVMFYIPGRGGYFFSTDAPKGLPFVKAGWIEGSRMQFTLENETYECVARAPILMRVTRGEVWVYHDRQYKPSGNWTVSDPAQNAAAEGEFFTAASDSLNWFPMPNEKQPIK